MIQGVDPVFLLTSVPGEVAGSMAVAGAGAIGAMWRRLIVERDQFLKREEARDTRDDTHRQLVVDALAKISDEFHQVQLALKDVNRAG